MTRTVVESKTKTAIIGFDQPFCVIGERINPTGRKKLAAELEAGDFSTVEKDALEQVACGATGWCRVWSMFHCASTARFRARWRRVLKPVRAARC
jgi:hypothetical protein